MKRGGEKLVAEEFQVGSEPFAGPADYRICRDLHQKFGTTYFIASQFFPRQVRRRVHAVYGFVRVPDEWVDNPNGLSPEEQRTKLRNYRNELLRGLDGVRPNEPVLRAFCDVARECGLPLDEALCFLDAMEMDIDVHRYESFADLRTYTRGSAGAVGILMCSVLGMRLTPEVGEAAKSLGDAMQLTNFLRDVKEDWERGRLYLPQEDLRTFDITEADIQAQNRSENWKRLMKFEVARARAMYELADPGISMLPKFARRPVRIARRLYSQILVEIEKNDYDVFSSRARVSSASKLTLIFKNL